MKTQTYHEPHRGDGRNLNPAAQEALRQRVIGAIVKQGMPQVEAVRVFGVGRTSIHNWLKAYHRSGWQALKCRKRGRPPCSRLTGPQAATIVRLIEGRCPDQLKLPFVLWTRQAVAELVSRRSGIALSVWTIGRYLKRWGFTPQKPLRRAYQRDPQAVQRWLEQVYPAIQRQARGRRAEIHWGDEMGLRSDYQTGRSYGRKGQTPVIGGTGLRFGCNMISTLTNRGRLAFMVFRERFTAAVMIRFLRRLLRHSRRMVFLIVDSHPVHVSKRVERWVQRRCDRLRMFFLPGYSPELNPDEYLNQDVKSDAVGRQRPKDQPQMIRQVRSYLRGTQRRPAKVRNYFQHENVRYAAL